MIIKIFCWGILAALGALVFEFLYLEGLKILSLQNVVLLMIGGAAFIEEYLKYFVVKKKVLKSSEFDEPIDAMLYLIIAALGFAAAENIFLLNGLYMTGVPINEILQITIARFLGAVFLHALASGIIGYFLARSLLLRHKRKSFVGLGILIATCLHGIYNYIIIEIGPYNEHSVILIIGLIILMAISVSWAFKNLNKLKSICKPLIKS
ncbi:MAG: PrsW family intramembrane metalloprotease [Candidatus Omnitrophica bacterium]|nr:PrsW family intramembrane metalloprotease [Candidatus Omnitrophota bacterium]